MDTEPQDILDAALALPANQRVELAQRLLASVKPPNALGEDDADFFSVLQQRVARYEAGETQAAPWEAVRERVIASLERQHVDKHSRQFA